MWQPRIKHRKRPRTVSLGVTILGTERAPTKSRQARDFVVGRECLWSSWASRGVGVEGVKQTNGRPSSVRKLPEIDDRRLSGEREKIIDRFH